MMKLYKGGVCEMKKSRFAMIAATAVAIGMILTACGSDDKSAENNTNKQTEQTNSGSTDSNKNSQSTGNEQVVNITASNWKWELDKTEVKAGQPVKLVVTGKEGLHGLTVMGADAKIKNIPPGKTETVTFTPDKEGELKLVCSVACGTGHSTMTATLKVVK
jgi:cytochrome c oxidase subunit 2